MLTLLQRVHTTFGKTKSLILQLFKNKVVVPTGTFHMNHHISLSWRNQGAGKKKHKYLFYLGHGRKVMENISQVFIINFMHASVN